MYRILLVCVFIGGSYYLFQKRAAEQNPIELPPPPKPPVLQHEPPLVLSDTEIEKIRLATMDGDPSVRWAAIDLLYRVRDPRAYEILEKSLRIDSESDVRRKALAILKKADTPDRVRVLVGALADTEEEIRLAALIALGEIGDPESIPAIVKVLRDTESIVRRQALSTLGAIQTKQNLDHQMMQDQIRQEYEKALLEHEQKIEELKNPAKRLLAPLKTEHKDLIDLNKVE